ncbi:Tat pathway signal sequence [Collinsella sp. D33t1_170424_A12]|uniref:Tat pathway signal sequence n=1 Tax=Collinsella sp. D33t1_170424_A12 TaxID=2787135 RepID=UPI001897B995
MAQGNGFDNDDFQDMLHTMFGFSSAGFGSDFGDDAGSGHDGPIPVDAVVDGEGRPAGSAGKSGGKNGGSSHGAGGFAQRVAQWSRRAFIALAILLAIALAVGYWWFHPALNLQSPRVWSWILMIAFVAILGLQVAAIRSAKHRTLFRRLVIVPGAFVVAFFLGILLGQPFVPGNAERFASVLKTTEGDFAKDIEQVDYSEVPVIDRDSAVLLGNRAMGSIPEYVSQFEISPAYSQINYQGRPVRVSPLTYADLFKWFSNRGNGIPAYVLVDMVTQEAEVVRLKQPIKYSESEPLARNIDRYAQLKYPTYMFDQKSFELDEEGTPWWVFPVQKRTIGLFEGTTINRVVLVNACTGETADYAIDEVPAWVDRAYPSDLLIQQYNWSGAYGKGWLNSILGQVGVVRTTPGKDGQLGYNYLAQGGDIYLYSGVTSVTADSSSIGFILVNQRTGESHFYSVPGATEDSAMDSAEGQVQNLKYQATYPLLLNVSGQPTYFMALKDNAGLVKMYAMINVQHYQAVATGSTVASTQESYLAMLAVDGTLSDEEAAAAGAEEKASGKIASIAQAVIDGNSHFYVTLEGDGAIYDFALPDMLEIVRYRVGDAIEFGYAKPSDDGASTRQVVSLGGVRAKAEEAPVPGTDVEPAGEAARG